MEINIGGELFFISVDDAEDLYNELDQVFNVSDFEENINHDEIILKGIDEN